MARRRKGAGVRPVDRLSSLPDELLLIILSFLPTRTAARTSFLSRRFRHLWKASPSIDIDLYPYYMKKPKYVAMLNTVLLSRKPSNPLLRLRFKLDCPDSFDLSHSFISSLLEHASSLGLRHLTIDGYWNFTPCIPTVFSITSLESLKLPICDSIPSGTTLTHLKSLSLCLNPTNSAQVERLLLELCCLEHLKLWVSSGVFSLSSLTIKKLELNFHSYSAVDSAASARLSMPSLNFLYVESTFFGESTYEHLPHIHGNIPLLRKSVINLSGSHPEHVAAVAQLLNCISHVEELSLHLMTWFNKYPFCNFLEPGKEAPSFSNLKHLDARMCFHEHNFEAVVSLLRQSPALQSVKLVHMVGLKRMKKK
ncbi:F-box protein family [Rhynchospora pubera]|uniref:F-box protein family n=1 Tax=Rhynchospora pubera TaxID=906938 RepID=A0AAV8EIV2_9POAL|nr:F-box protein family [Rhynchospora pubera]